MQAFPFHSQLVTIWCSSPQNSYQEVESPSVSSETLSIFIYTSYDIEVKKKMSVSREIIETAYLIFLICSKVKSYFLLGGRGLFSLPLLHRWISKEPRIDDFPFLRRSSYSSKKPVNYTNIPSPSRCQFSLYIILKHIVIYCVWLEIY